MLAHIACLWPVNDIYSCFLWNLRAKRHRSWNRASVQWKSRSYGLLIWQVLPLHVSASKRSPRRMQLFPNFGIGFGFWLISDLPISEWCGFPDSTSLIGLRVNLHLTLQSWLNRSFTWSCSSETSIFWLKKNFLLSWFSDCWKSQLCTGVLPCYLARNVTEFHLFWNSDCLHAGFKYGRIPETSKTHLLEFYGVWHFRDWNLAQLVSQC